MDTDDAAELILFGFWALTPKNATHFRDNKQRKGGDKVPVFVPPRDSEPEFSGQPKPDGHISVYQRTGGKGLKEELDPPPRNVQEATDQAWADEGKNKYRYLEQYEINHPEISSTSFIDKPGQILFNRKSIGNIHRNELFNQKDVLRDKNSNLATELQKKNRDLYVNYFGELREKETIETHYDFKERVNVYYFDRN